MKKIFPILLLLLIIGACNDEPCSELICQNDGICMSGSCDCPTGYAGEFCEEKLYLLKLVNIDGALKDSFFYDDDNRILESHWYNGDEVFRYISYKYDNDSVFVYYDSIYGDLEIFFSHEYRINEDSVAYGRADVDGNIAAYSIFTQRDENCGYAAEGSLNSATIFLRKEFIDHLCSYKYYTVVNQFGEERLIAEVIKDDQNFVSASTSTPLFKFPNQGNVIEYIQYDLNGDIIASNSYTADFEYNIDGYPTSQILNFNDGSILEYSYEYY